MQARPGGSSRRRRYLGDDLQLTAGLSAGSGRYAGDTMEAALTARVPGPNGQPVDTPGRITGRYLGPCDAK